MRIVRGYTAEGAAIWSENQPSYARVPSHGGSLVTGGPGWRENRSRRKDQENADRRERRAARKEDAA